MPKRLLIIDDDETWRFLYRYQLRHIPDFQIIAEFETAEDALLQIHQLKPDLVIVDYILPGMTGIEFTRRLESHPDIKVLLATGHERDHFNSMMENSQNFDIIEKVWSEKVLGKMRAFCN